jgi:hypothetical protein
MKKFSTALLLMFAFATVGFFSFNKFSRASHQQHKPIPKPPPTLPSEPRAVYPLSIVPGGVRTIEDLKRAMLNDIVARNFSGFDMSEARFERLSLPECTYVSFRRKSHVAWTRHCVWLSAGELVLTDGRLRFRAKCGNRISETRQVPTAKVDTAQMEIPMPDAVPAQTAPPAVVTSAAPVPGGPVETPIFGPPPPSGPICCDTPIGNSPIVPIGGPPVGSPRRTSLDAGDDWKAEAAVGILLLVILGYRRRLTRSWRA